VKYFAFFFLLLASCRPVVRLKTTVDPAVAPLTGSGFYQKAAAYTWSQRDSLALEQLMAGNLPSFLTRLVPVTVSGTDSVSGKKIGLTFYVTADYLSLGTDEDWARIDITAHAAQQLADHYHCFLPTRKMVNDIWQAATVKLEPVPMYAFRDSTPTMYQHHLIIEGQRKSRKGLIAGIKKDVVISGKIKRDPRPDRLAIYGWHQLNGKPIQPLFTGHIWWWVDYSQGIRLVYEKVRVDGKWMHYPDVFNDPKYHSLLCDEEYCEFYKYPY
jgi:hypothetical protein